MEMVLLWFSAGKKTGYFKGRLKDSFCFAVKWVKFMVPQSFYLAVIQLQEISVSNVSSLVLLANVITATACEYKLLSLKKFVLT